MHLVSALLAVTFAVIYVQAAPPNLSPPVNTKNGILIGYRVTVGGIEAYEFDAIPFAEPPVGNLRFKKTQPKQRWSNALLCMDPPPSCSQVIPSPFGQNFTGTATMRPNTTMSEDCLYLNIWVPRAALDQLYYQQMTAPGVPPSKNLPLLPVMVYFHSGGFTIGSANCNRVNGTVLSAFNNVIVVTVQYRLGALGFLYSGTDDAPGNQGLWDQLEALRWINANIASFGGDPNATTIAGHDAGSASVSYHLLSPYSRQYFQRAILQSGTAMSDWAISTPNEAKSRSNRLAAIMSTECDPNASPTQDTTVTAKLSCLRQIADIKFPQRQGEVLQVDDSGSAGLFPYPFLPVVDGDFIPRMPRDMLQVGDFYNVSVLMGMTKEEGSIPVDLSVQGLKLLPNPLVPNRTFDNFDSVAYEGFIQSYFSFYPRNWVATFPVVQEGIRLIYSSMASSAEIMMGHAVVEKIVQAVGDWAYVCPTILWADTFSDAPDDYLVKVFFYYFTQRSTMNPWPQWMGVTHGEEMPFIFGEPFANYAQDYGMVYTDEEKLLSRVMMAYWSNFAKFGDPNRPDPSSRNQANSLSLRPWPMYDATIGRMAANMNIETRVRQEGEGNIYGPKRRECAFWNFLSKVQTAITIAQQCGKDNAEVLLASPRPVATTQKPQAVVQQTTAQSIRRGRK